MDGTQKFNGLAGDYMIGRPAYATEFVEYLYTKYGFSAQSIIADIGSGTGKFAKQLLKKGRYFFADKSMFINGIVNLL